MPSQRLKSLELALAKLIDASRQIDSIDNWTIPAFDEAIRNLTLNAKAAERLLHKP